MASVVVPLRRFVDDEQWEAEDLAGRLGTVAHAASHRAGLVPYGDAPSSGHLFKRVDEIGPSAPSLSRRYTAPPLARREGAEVAMLELRGQGDGGVAFRAHLLTRCGDRVRVCQATLDEATLAPLLSGRLDDAARALSAGGAGAWIWRSLADGVFRVFLLELCRRNDLPVTGFLSLPDDAVVNILHRLADGEDLARVECTSRQLGRVAAERDAELWKPLYLSLGRLTLTLIEGDESSEEPCGSWKERYVNARQQPPPPRLWSWPRLPSLFFDWDDEDESLVQLRRERERPFFFAPVEPIGFDWTLPLYLEPDPPAPEPEPEREVVARRKNAGRRHRDRKVERNDYMTKQRHGAGATHSPSSRYRWKHR